MLTMSTLLYLLICGLLGVAITQELPWPPTADPGPKVNNGNSLTIGGHTCLIKDTKGGIWGPGKNVFVGSEDFIWTDQWGLHLNIRPRNGCNDWASSECFFDRPLGYGNYVFRIVGPLETQDYQTVLGAFTWDDDCPGDCWYREIDFEWTRWGWEEDYNNGQFVVQPFTRQGNVKRFPMTEAKSFGGELGDIGGGECNDPSQTGFNGAKWSKITAVMQWFPNMIRWYVFDGLWTLASLQTPGKPMLASWEYGHRDSVFTPGNERVHLNLWQANDGRPAYGRRVHFIFNGFEHSETFIDFNSQGYPSNRLLLSSGTFIPDLEDADIEQLIADADLTVDEEDKGAVLAAIRAHIHETANAKGEGSFDGPGLVEWLKQLAHVTPVAGETEEAEEERETALDVTKEAISKLRVLGREKLHVVANKLKIRLHKLKDMLRSAAGAGERRMQQAEAHTSHSMSGGDPRGDNLEDFGAAAMMYGSDSQQQDNSLYEGEMSGYSMDPSALYAGEITQSSAEDIYAGELTGSSAENAYASEWTGNAADNIYAGETFGQTAESIYAGESVGSDPQTYDSFGQTGYMQGMAASGMSQTDYPANMDGDVPSWLADARDTGYYGPNGYVPPTGGGSSGGSNKGVVIGLSVAGAIVGLVSLFTAGFILRKRMQHRADRSSGATGARSSRRAISKSQSANYKRLREMEGRDEAEMSPLAGRLDEDSDEHIETSQTTRSKSKVAPS